MDLVRMAATECPRIGLDDALAILLLIAELEPERFEPAAVKWAGRLFTHRPQIGIDGAQVVLSELGEMIGADRDVARRELGRALRDGGEPRLADALARG